MNHLVSSPKTQHGRQTQEAERNVSDSAGDLIWMAVLGFAACAIVAFFVVRGIQAKDRLQKKQWRDMNSAVFLYQSHLGERPPATDVAAIEGHFNRRYESALDFDAFVEQLPHQLEDLDESEAVLFWLGGTARQAAGFAGPIIIQPDPGRIIDSDRDGWPELTDCRKNIFLLRHGKMFVLDPVTNQATPANRYRK